MIKDLLEMRVKNWTARRETEKAKKLSEVHDEAAREEQGRSISQLVSAAGYGLHAITRASPTLAESA